MRRAVGYVLALTFATIVHPLGAAAQDADALRKELHELRHQFDQMRQHYERSIESLADRLKRLETQPPGSSAGAPAVPVATTPPPAGGIPASGAPPGTGQVAPGAPTTAADLLRPRQPFSLSERRGGGQLLFDMGIAGDFVANLTQDNVDKADQGTFFGRENRFFPREIELSLFGQIDPYARGEMRIEAAEEFEDGGRELHLGLAEANLTLLTLPLDTQLKLGLMRNRFGLLNQNHAHDLPQIDRPAVLVRFFGEEGLVESGAELTWVAPLPFYLELLAGVFTGDNEDAFGRGTLKMPLLTGRARTFFDFDSLGAIQLGASVARGYTPQVNDQTYVGGDLKYKLTLEGWRHPLLTLAGEAIWAIREFAGPRREDRTLDRFGAYGYAEVQPWKRWAFGLRYDWTDLPVEERVRERAIEPYVTFRPSDFLLFRLAYKRTDRQGRAFFNTNDASARLVDELLFQASFILGAHPAHPF